MLRISIYRRRCQRYIPSSDCAIWYLFLFFNFDPCWFRCLCNSAHAHWWVWYRGKICTNI